MSDFCMWYLIGLAITMVGLNYVLYRDTSSYSVMQVVAMNIAFVFLWHIITVIWLIVQAATIELYSSKVK